MKFHDFDPYEALMSLGERLSQLEQAHNRLAHAYEATAKEQQILLHKYRNLEKSHMALASHVFKEEIDRLNSVK